MTSITELPSSVRSLVAGYSRELVFRLNGRKVVLSDPDPLVSLADYLRGSGLTGTKIGCAQGGCGACTVMISTREGNSVQHRAINACLRPLVAVAGTHVTTVEGIGNVHDGLDPVQHRLALANGTQCGYCTPGFVMNAHACLRERPAPTQQDIEDLFGGNLCRCTGYRPILQGLRTFACDYDANADPTMKCEADPFFTPKVRGHAISVELGDEAEQVHPLYFHAHGVHWFRPASLAEAQELKRRLTEMTSRDQVRVVVGNTASVLYPNEKPRLVLAVGAIRELNETTVDSEGLHLGAALPIQHLLDTAKEVIASQDADKTTGLRELVRHGQYIAGVQVRNAGSIGGNIFLAKGHTRQGTPFPADLMTVLGTLGATVTITSRDYNAGSKDYPLLDMPAAEDLPADALLLSFHIPFSKPDEYVQTYRVARRPQMAHPIINAGFACRVGDNGEALPGSVRVVVGGLTSCNGRLPKTEAALAGAFWDDQTLRHALTVLHDESRQLVVPAEEEGFTEAYRLQLVQSFFYKFFVHVALRVEPDRVAVSHRSAGDHPSRPLSSGRQGFEVRDEHDPITRPIIKREAFAQATGEAAYTQDEPLPENGCQAVLVTSDRPHARFHFAGAAEGREAVESLLREKIPGFIALVTSEDVPSGGSLLIGIGQDDPVFSPGIATHVGAPLCLAAAKDRATARRAAEFVRYECIRYEDLPAVTTLEEAIEKRTIMPHNPDGGLHEYAADVTRAGSDAAWLADPSEPMPETQVISGDMRTGAQAHFYMETMSALAIPGKYDQMTVLNSTQSPNSDQAHIARALGVLANQVTVRVEQLGGGFGGKQNRSAFIGAMAAIAARKLRCPVRVVHDRETDMRTIGKRHPYLGEYHVAFRDDGTLMGIRLHLSSDGGDTNDCSFGVMKGSVMMSDGAYRTPTFRSTGTIYRTNKASNTAMRTFGQVQPHLILEDAVEHVAHELSKRIGRKVLPEEIRRRNLYRSSGEGSGEPDATHFGQPLWYCDLREQWDQLYESADFACRAGQVEEFNSNHRWRKRGISMIPQKYGIGFKQLAALNTSSALVNVNKCDGSVVVVHGGVEMGQGLHTKIAQVAARELNLPLSFIRVAGNSTETIVNAPSTAASTGFDLNGGAVALACRTLRARLERFFEQRATKGQTNEVAKWRQNWREAWPEIVAEAWTDRVALSAVELYAAPHHDEPRDRFPTGRFFAYFTYSFSVSEVEIDVLTGEHIVLRTDILYDAGRSSNPAIDIGQIEGGFVQGLGFVTTEEMLYDEAGRPITDNIWTYKPPCTKSIPLDLRVTLASPNPALMALQEQAHLVAVQGTKSATEPCLSLGNSVYFAIKHAVMDARRELTGRDDWLRLDVPATCQRIQQSCGVHPKHLTLARE